MPISREAFQNRIPGDQEDASEEFADGLDYVDGASGVDPSASVDKRIEGADEESKIDFDSRDAGEARATESPQEVRQGDSPTLPPADPTSAEKEEAFGAAHPQRETRRSVATGRDVPQFTSRSQKRGSMEINWGEAHAQREVYERRARAQKSAATEHLARIHDIVELLLEMSEAHSNDGERKLQSLESKVAELEMRYAVNRASP
jgi:hypothetical protein